jgi:hypothetical protein
MQVSEAVGWVLIVVLVSGQSANHPTAPFPLRDLTLRRVLQHCPSENTWFSLARENHQGKYVSRRVYIPGMLR